MMPVRMNLTTIKFKRISTKSRLRFSGQPTDEASHKKQFSTEVSTTGQVRYNDYNKFDPAFSGDMVNSRGFVVLSAVEYDRLVAAGTPLEKGCRFTELAGLSCWFVAREAQPQGHTSRGLSTGVSIPTIYRFYFEDDSEETGGLKRV